MVFLLTEKAFEVVVAVIEQRVEPIKDISSFYLDWINVKVCFRVRVFKILDALSPKFKEILKNALVLIELIVFRQRLRERLSESGYLWWASLLCFLRASGKMGDLFDNGLFWFELRIRLLLKKSLQALLRTWNFWGGVLARILGRDYWALHFWWDMLTGSLWKEVGASASFCRG